ncbi:DNA repair protein Rad60 [Malaya genurostris]|uniref:DNA repair protein Rad60 n=1 Tax=Malaya genurostris TaxID=325434 RepID=UPI0026F3DA46|nr:DNA repair protein Rad60 [Malaya genurostris]
MSHQYDIFDNLNNYLDKSDDCVIPDEDLELNNEDSIVEPTPDPPTPVRKKCLPKKNQPHAQALSPKKSKQNKQAESAVDEIPATSKDIIVVTDDLVSNSNVEAATMDQNFKELEQMYTLIFKQICTDSASKRHFSSLKKRYQSLLSRRSASSRRRPTRNGTSLLNELTALKEIFYDICVNHNLMTPNSMSSTLQTNGTVTNKRRRRSKQPTVIDVVNLVDSPALVLPGVINLDSEEENVPTENKADYSFDSENYEMSIKIKWRGDIQRFVHRKYQKFSDLIAKLAEKVDADPSCIILDVNDRIIDPNDTPDSIDYKISQFITGRAVEQTVADMFAGKQQSKQAKPSKSSASKNSITLKLQSDKWKQPLHVQVEKTQKMSIVAIKAAEELKCKPAEIRLSFDGDLIDLDLTPLDLELEGDEVLDLRISKQ